MKAAHAQKSFEKVLSAVTALPRVTADGEIEDSERQVKKGAERGFFTVSGARRARRGPAQQITARKWEIRGAENEIEGIRAELRAVLSE